jgi:hypothetical protein
VSDRPVDRPVPPPAHASARKRAYTHHGTNDGTSTKRDNHLPLITGHLSPWADPLTGALGWQVTTASRRLAVAVAAISGGKAHPHEKGEWQACIPQALLTVTATGADSGALWCRLGSRPDSGCLTVTFAPWTAATVLKCP